MKPAVQSVAPPSPVGWTNVSAYRFIAPDRKQMMGRLMPMQMPGIRAQLTVTSEIVDEKLSLNALVAERPLPMGVTPISEENLEAVEGGQPRLKRVYRFSDPLRGWLIQRSETFIKEDNHLYVTLLSSNPMDFEACEGEITTSRRVLVLAQGAS